MTARAALAGLLGTAALVAAAAGCAAGPAVRKVPGAVRAAEPDLRSAWGIELVSLRRTAGGNLLDFRFRVVDPDKAAPLVDGHQAAFAIDPESGTRHGVPVAGKVGRLRQTARDGRPKAGRTYFVLFSNPGGAVRAGQKLTVVIGAFRAEGVTVES